uniref:antitoxin Xre-like helix-turn-helix domain-containing protein n=1 Tax=Burkholderia arboris TaxID=488730 RepID=UPI003BEEFEA9
MVMETSAVPRAATAKTGRRPAAPAGPSRTAARPAGRARGASALAVTQFSEVYGATQAARVDLIKHGVAATDIARLAKSMGVTKERLLETLGLSAATINKKVRARQKLSIEQGERVVGIAKLVGQVQAMVERSGDPTDFNAAQWVASWLEDANPALGGRTPASYMDTVTGQELVSNLLLKAETGAYA